VVKTIAFALYPGITALDLVGPLQVMSALAEFDDSYRVVVAAQDRLPAATDTPLGLTASHTFAEVTAPDVLIVPGGMGPTFAALADEGLLAWIRTAAAAADLVVSVCTGSLLLGAAGLLEGRRAATHWATDHLLSRFGADPVRARWVEDGPVLTAAGVSAGIDMALHLVSRLAGERTARTVQLFIEYDPEPPLGAIDWRNVDADLFAPTVRSMLRHALTDHPDLLARLL
jgi:transcriptional regulator GlxA family with amidase domain